MVAEDDIIKYNKCVALHSSAKCLKLGAQSAVYLACAGKGCQ